MISIINPIASARRTPLRHQGDKALSLLESVCMAPSFGHSTAAMAVMVPTIMPQVG